MSYGFKMYDYCMRCGKIFKRTYATQDYCSMECRRGNLNRRGKPDQSIEEISKLAEQEHLSYGQYCAKYNI